jgi:hypothetical protein
LGRGEQFDSEETATTSEIARQGFEDKTEEEMQLPREVAAGQYGQQVSVVDESKSRKAPKLITISSDDGSSLSAQQITDYVGSEMTFLQQTRREATSYEESVVAFPLSAIPQDPVTAPRASAGIIARRYIQSEENISMH